jgi:peptidoglycan-N-acetylglucosamine deacetylase
MAGAVRVRALLLLLLLVGQCLMMCLCGPNPAYYAIEQKNGEKNIALTFDDGPHSTLTPRLLDALKEKGVKVTFFVMGIKVDLHPDVVAREAAEGHEVANHA